MMKPMCLISWQKPLHVQTLQPVRFESARTYLPILYSRSDTSPTLRRNIIMAPPLCAALFASSVRRHSLLAALRTLSLRFSSLHPRHRLSSQISQSS
jgi:hypothetical protein